MPFPDVPCPTCPRDPASGPCLAIQVRNPRYCEHAANGHEGYVALLKGDPPPPPDFPPLAEQARNLAVAVVAAVKSKGRRASPEESARRLSICGECEHFTGSRCKLCGCLANLKVRLDAWHCPDDPPRW